MRLTTPLLRLLSTSASLADGGFAVPRRSAASDLAMYRNRRNDQLQAQLQNIIVIETKNENVSTRWDVRPSIQRLMKRCEPHQEAKNPGRGNSPADES